MIIGASSSVDLWATQLARTAGFYIVGSCHTRNIALTREFGAHKVIDYTKMSIGQWIDDNKEAGGFDLVLDYVAPGGSSDAWYAAHPDHGLVLSIVPQEDMVWRWTLDRPEGISSNVREQLFIMEPNGGQLQKITEMIDAGMVKPLVDDVFGLEEFSEAYERADSGKATGKVILRIEE